MAKEKIGAVPLVYPVPIALVGAKVAGKPNFAEVGDVGILGIKPPYVMISLGEKAHTTSGILEHRVFSVNFPNTALMAKADYCGSHSGRDVDKSRLFTLFTDPEGIANLPMIEDCPVNLACEVVHHFTLEHRNIFAGKVIQCYVSDAYLVQKGDRKGIADLTQLDPLIYALDNQYYQIGEKIGQGYQEGKTLKH
jgi:flavin reductase (DIM6/NTAB) family NADH-FMN oxidoreductase RutF